MVRETHFARHERRTDREPDLTPVADKQTDRLVIPDGRGRVRLADPITIGRDSEWLQSRAESVPAVCQHSRRGMGRIDACSPGSCRNVAGSTARGRADECGGWAEVVGDQIPVRLLAGL